MKDTSICILLASILMITACSPSLVVTTAPHTNTKVAFSSNMSLLGVSLARRFLGEGDESTAKPTPLYNQKEVRTSLENVGVSLQSLTIPGGNDLVFEGTVSKLNQTSQGIFSSNTAGMTIILSRESINALISHLPPETADLLELLMAPVFTGELLDREEYLNIIAAAYGAKISQEIAAAVCILSIIAPEEILSTHVSTLNTTDIQVIENKKKVTLSLPLDLLLTLNDAITVCITWRIN